MKLFVFQTDLGKLFQAKTRKLSVWGVILWPTEALHADCHGHIDIVFLAVFYEGVNPVRVVFALLGFDFIPITTRPNLF